MSKDPKTVNCDVICYVTICMVLFKHSLEVRVLSFYLLPNSWPAYLAVSAYKPVCLPLSGLCAYSHLHLTYMCWHAWEPTSTNLPAVVAIIQSE